ncbi:MAG: alpha-L-rhamnosidase [Pirellulaceae bacterium]|mgnify:CR=1 FL=1|nr:alpha-L-rhamnosidase [Pirellulaceae bacterium]
MHKQIPTILVLAAMLFAPTGSPASEHHAITAASGPVSPDALGSVLSVDELEQVLSEADGAERWRPYRLNLAPARWIWLPSQRTLPNSFVLFRRKIELNKPLLKAAGWIAADSRYCLTVNGRRVQWGPAPCDPRNLDVDPVDLTAFLSPGKNVIGVEVLFFGHGDGTWPGGKPGMICHLTLEYENAERERIVSDGGWSVLLDRAHRPGQFKRWYLRSLQEEFDARLHPFGWDTADFKPGEEWLPAAEMICPPDKPASCSRNAGNELVWRAEVAKSTLRMRQIPPMRETIVPATRLSESGRVEWRRDPADWFEFRMPGCFEIQREPIAERTGDGFWKLPAAEGPRNAAFAIFELKEQVVGWPYFVIEAPAGTIVELICQEAHDPKAAPWLDSQYYNWSRFICREGVNRFETFDYESLRWLQLHVRNATGPVTIREAGVRRRTFNWPNEARVCCSQPDLQRLLDAAVNTLQNSAQEICADGMARERQQYSGDGGHQLISVRSVFGERRLSARFVRTFSEGLLKEGYFLDCWPACDRLFRLAQRQVDSAGWGPLLDHGVGFNFDCWKHYWETGDMAALDEPYPRLLVFADYLESIRGPDGLLPVEGIGVPVVWIDHIAFKTARHKQCSFNLYSAAMLEHALAPIARARGDERRAEELARRGRKLREQTVRRFWCPKRKLFVDNLPWLDEEKSPRLSDRALATAVLFDQCPGSDTAASVKALVECPPEMGLSYPCNACWRYWALAQAGRVDAVLDDFRRRWATMPSVLLNNTIQEDWTVKPDSPAEWSHCAMAPLLLFYGDVAGIRATAPGFASCRIRPQLCDLTDLDLTYNTVRGPIRFSAVRREQGGHRLVVRVPDDCQAELLLPQAADYDKNRLSPDHPLGLKRFRLVPGIDNTIDTSETSPIHRR